MILNDKDRHSAIIKNNSTLFSTIYGLKLVALAWMNYLSKKLLAGLYNIPVFCLYPQAGCGAFELTLLGYFR